MNRNTLKTICLAALIATAPAIPGIAQSPQQSFDEFRRGIMSNFDEFRGEILKDYDKFLGGEWVEYKSLKGVPRYKKPKPKAPPAVKPVAPAEPAKPVQPVEPAKPVQPVEPTKPVQPVEPTKPVQPVEPAKPVQPVEPAKPVQPVEPTKPVQPVEPAKPVQPVEPERPAQPEKPSAPAVKMQEFNYKGMTFAVPQIEVTAMNSTAKVSDFGARWRELNKDPKTAELVNALKAEAKNHGFNDYLTYDMVRAYVGSKYPQAHSTSQMSLIHYIMANLGYDVRLGLDSSTGKGLILMPSRQQLYGRPYLQIDNEKYYVFTDPTSKVTDNMRISTCRLPEKADKGAKFDMRLGELRLPYVPKQIDLSFGGLNITGEMNANLMPVVYDYPQMPIGDYAQSELAPELRRSVVTQLKSQLGDQPTLEAVDQLLSFVQNAFAYATDQDFHGFEKPYFFEETLFYPLCDCEDRVVFYSYLLWNVLGVENQLLTYPGHESAGVKLSEPLNADRYTDGHGDTYYISDPTYIGARTGMCMPQFRGIRPEIDYTYSDRQ